LDATLSVYATISYEAMPEEQPGYPLAPDAEMFSGDPNNPPPDFLDYRAFVDPRLAQLGVRTVTEEVVDEIDDEALSKAVTAGSVTDYNLLKILLGVVEGPMLSNKSPLHFNFDRTNCIAFSKRNFRGKTALVDAYYKQQGQTKNRMRCFPAVVTGEQLGVKFPILSVDRGYKLPDKMDRLIYTSEMKQVGLIV
jgi:hypothetical protein